MRNTTRDQAHQALFELLVTTPLPNGTRWGETGRNVKDPSEVPSANQPALFLTQAGVQVAFQKTKFFTQWTWKTVAWIYFRSDASPDGEVADTTVNNYLDAVEQTVDPVPGQRQTLNGLVYHCFIDGEVFASAGLMTEPQAVILIPISIIPIPGQSW
jgi:hypothetical protein